MCIPGIRFFRVTHYKAVGDDQVAQVSGGNDIFWWNLVESKQTVVTIGNKSILSNFGTYSLIRTPKSLKISDYFTVEGDTWLCSWAI